MQRGLIQPSIDQFPEYGVEAISPLAPFDCAGVKRTRLNVLAARGRILAVRVRGQRCCSRD
jgi:hypothetical protein